MVLTFDIKGSLDEAAIRHIVREAETGMADGADAKTLLVQAAAAHMAADHATLIEMALREARETADMLGIEVDLDTVLADVKAQIGSEYDAIMADVSEAPAWALAKAQVDSKLPLPMNRGKWLSKLGITKAHVDAISSGSTASSPPPPPDLVAAFADPETDAILAGMPFVPTAPVMDEYTQAQAAVLLAPPSDDIDLADMLGLTPGVPAAPLAPPSAGGAAAPAAAPPPAPSSAPSAAPPDSVPPPPNATLRDAFVLFGDATDKADDKLAARLGTSRSSLHNWTSGKTASPRVTLAQARAMAAECDNRAAMLRQAAAIFGAVRE